MKASNELLIDIISMKQRSIELYINELKDSVNEYDESKLMIDYDIELKQKECEFLDLLKIYVNENDNGLKCLKKFLKNNRDDVFSNEFIKIDKFFILKQLLKEYSNEYKKNYWDKRRLGLKGVFDNKLFCDVIKNKINKYTMCNRVTRKKYNHLTAFLNELLYEMENAEDPLKTLSHKMKLYKRYKKTEYIEIRKEKINKIKILKDILEEYNKEKQLFRDKSVCSK